MTERTVTHARFTIERIYDAAPARVFAAWADPAAKKRWFSGPEEWGQGPHELDFRPGGGERASGGPKSGPVHTYQARYYDIVPDQRIVSTYEMYLDETRISVSLAVVELKPAGGGTRLVYTEHGAFLDGFDKPQLREDGTRELLEALGRELQRT
jgi:uncharacterized protein YndB with AHSA1/START domain